jgi:hypothetical protein
MDSQNATATSVVSEFESGFSKILPDLAKLLQKYQISKTLQIDVGGTSLAGCTCCLINGAMKCGSFYGRPGMAPEDTLGLTFEKAEQFCKDVEAKLSEVFSSLSEATKQTNETFKLYMFINPTPDSPGKPVVCQWVSQGDINTLECSNS